MVRAYNFYCAEEAIANRMNLGYQKGGRGNTAHKRFRRTLAQSDLGSTYSSDSFNERKCMLEFAAVVKENPGPAGAGVVLHDEDTSLVCYLREGLGTTTKGVAEYKALILGLKYALARGYTHIRAEGYSTHVCIQVNGMWRAKSSNMLNLYNVVMDLKEKFQSFEIFHVEREYDNEADEQANMAVHLNYGEVQEGVIGDDSNFEPLLESQLETLSSAYH
ncbi:polynucleotidyl transferase, ribonuclease H-like superfamily protein [Artemisia annua]|uniref:Polynucleotidyl transferase, ribonuclease H-like superfamily protein n=1 Tax=Artemisia annua TaxID=35608 RepID=A0A2U1PHN1_ARTAN|nr:polynucleotidyl transferase, ribonuclease H-like superfamily protein [Artemisia annua]